MIRTFLANLQQQSDGWLATLFGAGAAGVWLPGSLFFGTFLVTEDLSCVAGGIFAAEGRLSYLTATIACMLGIYVGDVGLYVIGWLTMRGLLRWRWARRRVESLMQSRWRRAFEDHGVKILFTSRFLPGTRVPSYMVAGAIGWPFLKFAAVLGIAVVIWTPLLVGAAALSGKVVLDVLEQWGAYAWFAVPIALVIAWLVLRVMTMMCSWRGRRLLYGRWLRFVRWEYWSPVFVFPPIILDLVRLAFVHRTLAVFTACNRDIPLGGLFGESKGDILDLMPSAVGDGVSVARYRRLLRTESFEERMAQVRAFLADGKCVLKPDQGERGAGVTVVRNETEAQTWLEACPYDAIVQEFVDGAEFGVAWCRSPKTGRGEIHSIAHKVLPEVVGDGQRTLEELILAGDRTVAMARFHLKKLEARLRDVPADGERVPLGDLGTHARGATFYDVRELASDELHAAFDQFLQDVPGVDFGRFDVRAPSLDALREGRGVRVMEFNGVTGEAAHVYQPGYPWYRGVADMVAHMRRASAIGAANRRNGHAPATLRELLGVLLTTIRRPGFEYEAQNRKERTGERPVCNVLPRDVSEA